ncbi:MAG: ATP-binding protein, partial [Clostridiales bacterium]|nr:ATP-binding protein [Clostridiales bacterium]
FYVKDNEEHLNELHSSTLETIRQLMQALEKASCIPASDCSIMVISGNTTMIHFLLGIDPWFVFHWPYTPAFNSCGFLYGNSLDLPFPGLIYCLPSVANYGGGDIVSGVLCSELYLRDELALYVDIGTNGEMVLGNKDFLLMAAGAAGPALEGGISKQGMQAKPGAVDSVIISGNVLTLTTIQNARPIGICGSGIVDLIAQMLLEGWIDMSGTFVPGKSERIVSRENEYAVLYARSDESGSGEELIFTQHDIFSFMDTKAAANTMIVYLLDAAGIEPGEVRRIYLAGAFGKYLNLESAITIGLYPDLPRERFVVLGNGSLLGASKLLLDASLYHTAEEIIEKIDYLSLGEMPDFLTKMYAAKFLPHTDLDLYPSVKEKLMRRSGSN